MNHNRVSNKNEDFCSAQSGQALSIEKPEPFALIIVKGELAIYGVTSEEISRFECLVIKGERLFVVNSIIL